ncbi:MAG: response regulator [Deltaproteobacteria bacterium]|nr:response regulator [Deltaproteobacteria bacterium]
MSQPHTRDLPILVPPGSGLAAHTPYLVVLRGGTLGQAFRVDGDITIGRNPECGVRLMSDSVSRVHARVFRSVEREYVLEDLDSRNGTFVNGVRIRAQILHDGDRVQIGHDVLVKFAFYDELDQQLREAQKLEALGSLAGGVAHDFNNLLTVILGGVSYLQEALAAQQLDVEDAKKVLVATAKATEQAALLTHELLGFARRGQFEQSVVDMAQVAEKTVRLISRTFDRIIHIETEVEENLAVIGDRVQLEQALLNLCLNAREAMPSGGTLRIIARSAEVSSLSHFAQRLKPGAYVELRVSDTGAGMDEETRRRVFEPFFSVKRGGSGLALATVYGITRSHGGAVDVQSQPGQGSTFSMLFPRHEGSPAVPGPLPHVTTAPAEARSAVVLVVDDEDAVRDMLRRLLERSGYKVIEAHDGVSALESYREHQSEIGLVILDLVMPQMAGAEVFRHLRDIDPEVRVLVSTGFDDGQAEEVVALGASGYLRKPYRLRDMVAAVQQALAEKPGS